MNYMFNMLCILLFVLFTPGREPVDYLSHSLSREIRKINNTPTFSLEADSLFHKENEKTIEGKVFIVSQNQGNPIIKYAYVGRVETCRAGGCDTPTPAGFSGSAEYFDYFILFDKKMTIKLVKIFNYQATHGYEVSAKGWLKQFVGFNGKRNLRIGHDIDTISGATISVYQITRNIERVTNVLAVWYRSDVKIAE